MKIEEIIQDQSDNEASFTIPILVYSESVILKTAYIFIDKCYVYIDKPSSDKFLVCLKLKDSKLTIDAFVGEFLNELLNQKLQEKVDQETGRIRELLVAQAFSDVELISNSKTPNSKDDDFQIKRLRSAADE